MTGLVEAPSPSDNTGLIVGVCVGVTALALLVAGILFWKSKQKSASSTSRTATMSSQYGLIGNVVNSQHDDSGVYASALQKLQ